MQNIDYRRGFEQTIFRTVKTVSVRHEATVHSAAQATPVETRAHKKSADPSEQLSHVDLVDPLDMFEIGFQALKSRDIPGPSKYKSSLSVQTRDERDGRRSSHASKFGN